MSLPRTDTIVTYPSGDLEARASVIDVENRSDGTAVVLLDRTSCHPVDAKWPDQGADRAWLLYGETKITIRDAVVAATDGSALYLGDEIPVSPGTEGWAFVVAHIIDEADAPSAGDTVTVAVDSAYREALSRSHTACHLASLALNAALSSRWKKPTRTDDMGNPNFDSAANDSSRIRDDGSVDTYRLGKSLRKKGFIVEGIEADLPTIEQDLNDTLAGWLETSAEVRIERDGELLTDRRTWACELPGGAARIPCGGTHASSLDDLGPVVATLAVNEVDGAPLLSMRTVVGEHVPDI